MTSRTPTPRTPTSADSSPSAAPVPAPVQPPAYTGPEEEAEPEAGRCGLYGPTSAELVHAFTTRLHDGLRRSRSARVRAARRHGSAVRAAGGAGRVPRAARPVPPGRRAPKGGDDR
ncbi:hypothetical protein ACWGJ2_21215 [Streptomyces sp. NPDC054796]